MTGMGPYVVNAAGGARDPCALDVDMGDCAGELASRGALRGRGHSFLSRCRRRSKFFSGLAGESGAESRPPAVGYVIHPQRGRHSEPAPNARSAWPVAASMRVPSGCIAKALSIADAAAQRMLFGPVEGAQSAANGGSGALLYVDSIIQAHHDRGSRGGDKLLAIGRSASVPA